VCHIIGRYVDPPQAKVGVREVSVIVNRVSFVVCEGSIFNDMNFDLEIRVHIGANDSQL
jgi:hypothetical protein